MKKRLWKLGAEMAKLANRILEVPFVLSWDVYSYCENKAAPAVQWRILHRVEQDKSKLN
jgi:hypothetical protein